MRRVQLSLEVCNKLFHFFKENEYQRATTEADVGFPVFDSIHGEVLCVSTHGPNCNQGCCEDIPFDIRCVILKEINKLDDLLRLAENTGENYKLHDIKVSEPPRYNEIPHNKHEYEHRWLDEWAGEPCGSHIGEALRRLESEKGLNRYKYEEYVNDRIQEWIVDWLDNLSKNRKIVYEFEREWLRL